MASKIILGILIGVFFASVVNHRKFQEILLSSETEGVLQFSEFIIGMIGIIWVIA